MADLFLKVVNLSICASWLIAACIVVRFLLKKTSKGMRMLLWGLVAFRLICPVTLESVFSLIPRSVSNGDMITEWTNGTVTSASRDWDQTAATNEVRIESLNNESGYHESIWKEPVKEGDTIGHDLVLGNEAVVEPNTIRDTIVPILAYVWVMGIAVLCTYGIAGYRSLHSRVQTAVRVHSNIYMSEFVTSPFVLGIRKPKIYLPYSIQERELVYVVAHERAHIKRKDHWWMPLAFLLLSVHWFNPFMWVAYMLTCRDIELACDERVIKELQVEQRADYSQALLSCSVLHRMMFACPVAFGGVGVKERVKNVINYRNPSVWMKMISVVVIAAIAVCFFTAPVAAQDTSGNATETEKALETCGNALKAILDQEYYHVTYSLRRELSDAANIPDGVNVMDLPPYNVLCDEEIMKSGKDYLEIFYRDRDCDGTNEVIDGIMKKDGVKYRLDNEAEWDNTTPVAGWSVYPGLPDEQFGAWMDTTIFGEKEILSVEHIDVENGKEIAFQIDRPEKQFDKIIGEVAIYRLDQNGRLTSLYRTWTEKNVHGFDEEVTYEVVVTFNTQEAAYVMGVFTEQSVNCYRDFSWETDREAYAQYLGAGEYYNTSATSAKTVLEAITLAQNECTEEFGKIVVYRDEMAGMWKVEFQLNFGYKGYQFVYLDENGITCMVAVGESRK